MLAQLTSPNGIFSQLGVLVEENPPRPCSKLSKRTQPCKMAKFGKSSMGHGFHGFHGYVTNINKLPEGNPSFLGIANTSRTDQVWNYENPPASFRSSHHPPPKAPPWGHLTSMTLARHSPISTGYQLFLQPDHQKKYHKMGNFYYSSSNFQNKNPQKKWVLNGPSRWPTAFATLGRNRLAASTTSPSIFTPGDLEIQLSASTWFNDAGDPILGLKGVDIGEKGLYGDLFSQWFRLRLVFVSI